MSKKNILLIGGARSGKSSFALELVSKLEGPVLFVATAEAGDEEMRRRINEHRRARPAGWRTLEAPTGLGTQIRQQTTDARLVIIDCITLLVNNIFTRCAGNNPETIDAALTEAELTTEINELLSCIKQCPASFITITNEVGLGLVPANPVGRLYRDLLGRANQALARQADEVYFMVAGLPVKIKP